MGRPAVVPPAGRAWGGRFRRKRRGLGAAGSEIGALPGGRRVRWGWPERLSRPIGEGAWIRKNRDFSRFFKVVPAEGLEPPPDFR